MLVEVYKSSLYASVNNQIAEAKRRRAETSDWSPQAALAALVHSNFSPDYFSRENLLIWLSLWGEIAVNPRLKAAHRELYDAYRAELAEDIAAVAVPRGRESMRRRWRAISSPWSTGSGSNGVSMKAW